MLSKLLEDEIKARATELVLEHAEVICKDWTEIA